MGANQTKIIVTPQMIEDMSDEPRDEKFTISYQPSLEKLTPLDAKTCCKNFGELSLVLNNDGIDPVSKIQALNRFSRCDEHYPVFAVFRRRAVSDALIMRNSKNVGVTQQRAEESLRKHLPLLSEESKECVKRRAYTASLSVIGNSVLFMIPTIPFARRWTPLAGVVGLIVGSHMYPHPWEDY